MCIFPPTTLTLFLFPFIFFSDFQIFQKEAFMAMIDRVPKRKPSAKARRGIAEVVASGEINILERPYAITRYKHAARDSNTMGISDSRDGKIAFEEGLSNGSLGQTFTHEVIHAIADDLGISLNEEQVTGLAAGLFAVLSRNGLVTV
jgi:hypothetical protein